MNKLISIKALLIKENNNFELLRLIAALLVIYGHAYAITPQLPLSDYLGSLVVGEYSGSIAVKFFFFLSGIVIANSLLLGSSYRKFIVSRLVRIFPGLLVCAFLTAFFFPLMMVDMPVASYLGDPAVYKYFWNAITLRPSWALPGVFKDNPIVTVNGSLWTLPNEVFCYAALLGIGMVCRVKSDKRPFVIAISALWALLALKYIGRIGLPIGGGSDVLGLRLYFLVGALLAIFKNFIFLSARMMAVLCITLVLMRGTPAFDVFVLPFSFVGLLWVSSWRVLKTWRLPGDYSYGVYLYGFFVQQCLKQLFPAMDLHLHQGLAMVVTLVLGCLSWHFVEGPSMRLWQQVASRKAGAWVRPDSERARPEPGAM
jgi:peptidoglycan/LPS O-acetylase OafA/YrhL